MPSSETDNSNAKKGDEVGASMPSDTMVNAGTNASSGRGLKGWRDRLMNWRNSSNSSIDSGADGRGGGDTPASAPVASDVPAEKVKAPDQQSTDGGKLSTTAPSANDLAPAAAEAEGSKANAASINPSPARPMNIWLRRALERQAESAIAEAIRDGKPIPEAAVATLAHVASGVPAATPAEAVAAEAEVSAAAPLAKAPHTTTAAPQTNFAELMRQHREGLLPPTAQPPVKATRVIKRPKATEPPASVVTPAMEEKSPTPISNQKHPESGCGQPHAAPSLSEPEKAAAGEEGGSAQTTSLKGADSVATPSAAAPVHQAAVRKRTKAANNASVKCTQDTSAATPVAATPTHVTTVKGRASLEELRARRNRTTAGGSGSHHNTSVPGEGGAGGASSSSPVGGYSQHDEYNDSALDAVSRLLLRYCLGSRTTATTPSMVEAADGVGEPLSSAEPPAARTAESLPTTAQTTTELAFFDELMGLCGSNSLTPASLELLRELFQHVRVLHRPANVSCAGKRGESDDAQATTDAELDAEAYRVAARRREYVQQVIMVLLNRLKHMKTQEQQRRTQRGGEAAEAAAAPAALSAPPQPVIGHDAPLSTLPSCNPQHQSRVRDPEERKMASAAAYTTTVTDYCYPNPYAHLTVFSEHQPVAPPLDWPLSFYSRTAGTYCDPYGHYASSNLDSNSSVAARLVASPFPGAFPIIPPPATTDTSAERDDRELQELFRIIRAQLTQPVNTKPPRIMSTIGSGVELDGNLSGTAPVEVSQAERAVLRHVQIDFKRHMEQQRQQQTVSAVVAADAPSLLSPLPQTASTPPTASLIAPEPSCMHATTGAALDIADFSAAGVAAGTTRGVAAVACADSDRCPHHDTSLLDSAKSKQGKGGDAGKSSSARRTTATTQEESAVAAEMAPLKPHATILSFNATPFVPGGARVGTHASTATAIMPPTATSDSTLTKTTFNYNAKPFLPSGSANSPMMMAPQKQKQMNAAAQAFVPQQPPQPPQPPQPFPSSATSFSVSGSMPLNASRPSLPVMPPPPPPPGSAADPWASYEMFARWRDMMETYYQSMFATHNAAAVATGTSPSFTAAGGGPAPLAMMMTPPRSA
ncbi:hypothetical protein JKF63_06874 [Porcisia hertigi]|uniref:Uncharacterized protein n=1 Tax=Porcisia hertigi TaxID=2761500 RepID=A0A836LJA2_9TRYP|nr:hypothetical protein JKF63_06874 [Porcisia hertigi]